MANHTYTQERKLTKNMILHPGLFPNQGMKAKYSKDYAANLIIDMMMLGIELESFTEVEGGHWLPACYLHLLVNSDRDRYTNPKNYNWPNPYPDWLPTLWDMTKIHSLLFRYPSGPGGDNIDSLVRWDNISGMSPGYASYRVQQESLANPYRGKSVKSPDWATIRVRGLEFEVEYDVESYGHASNGWDDPGEAAEVTIWSCYTEVGNGERIDIDVSKGFEKLMEEIEEALVQHVHESDYENYGDGF